MKTKIQIIATLFVVMSASLFVYNKSLEKNLISKCDQVITGMSLTELKNHFQGYKSYESKYKNYRRIGYVATTLPFDFRTCVVEINDEEGVVSRVWYTND